MVLAGAAALAGCGGGGGGGSSGPSDTTSPGVVSVSPANGADAVARAAPVEIAFSEPVSAAPDAIALTDSRGRRVAGTSAAAGSLVRFTPARPLAFGETYTVAVTGVRDAAGNAATAPSTSFRIKQRNPTLALGGQLLQQILYEGWGPTTPAFHGFNTLADNGIEWCRAWVTTQSHPALRNLPVSQWRTLGWNEGYWSCLEMSAAVLQRAAEAGMRLQLALFLSDGPAHAGTQTRPAAWQGLAPAELAQRVREHAQSVATHHRSLGLEIEVFDLGSECDFRFCGYDLSNLVIPPGVDWTQDTQWMYDNLWSNYVPLFQAAIAGVKAVYPNARISLHLAGFGYSPGNVLPVGFFNAMAQAGVPFDIAGLSYPYMSSEPTVPQPYFAQPEFTTALDLIGALGKEVQILEFDYLAAPEGATQSPANAYPFTPAGQAAFVRDLATAVRGKVSRISYWAPDVFPGINGVGGLPPHVESGGLFSSATQARPALAVFNAIAEGELLPPPV